MYISVGIDVLDPAPGTGTLQLGGLTSRELQMILCGLTDLNLVGAGVLPEGVGDADAAVVLAVVEVFGQDLGAAHCPGGFDDRSVPV